MVDNLRKISTFNNTIHPGKFIKLVFMEPMGISVTDMADKLMISKYNLRRLLNGKSDITHDIAIRLSCVLGGSEQSWVNLQTAYDAVKVKENSDKQIFEETLF